MSASFAGDATYTGATRTGTLVLSPFSGFFPPVANPPTLNVAKEAAQSRSSSASAAAAVLRSSPPAYPRFVTTVCGTGEPTEEIKTTVTAGGSSLSFDASTEVPVRVEQGEGLTGFRRLELKSVDGSVQVADFNFSRRSLGSTSAAAEGRESSSCSAQVPLFAGCSKKELGEISTLADELSLPAARS